MNAYWLGVLSSVTAALLLTLLTRFSPLPFGLSFRKVMRDLNGLVAMIDADSDFHPQVLVSMNRSGSVVGGIMCGKLARLDVRNPLVVGMENSRVEGRRQTTIPQGRPDISPFERILFVSCVNDSGEAMRVALDWIRDVNSTATIRTAALYSNPKAVVNPTYVSQTIGDSVMRPANRYLTKMPWMRRSWSHDLHGERLRKRR